MGRVKRNDLLLCRGAARNTFYLKRLGVTHVLNTAEGNRNGTVNTNQVVSVVCQCKMFDNLQ